MDFDRKFPHNVLRLPEVFAKRKFARLKQKEKNTMNDKTKEVKNTEATTEPSRSTAVMCCLMVSK